MTRPIHYDSHSRDAVEFYYHIDTRTGQRTCQALCEDCYFKNTEVVGFKQELAEAQAVIRNLRSTGFNVTPIVSDTFGEDGAYLRSEVFNNHTFFLGSMAWSSGVPLITGDHRDLLRLLVKNGISLVAMTSHGTSDEESPLRGVPKPSLVRKAVALIKSFNRECSASIQTSLIFTIGKWNCNRVAIARYFEYCEELGVDILRINQFLDWSSAYPHLALAREDVVETYRTLKEVNDRHRGNVRLSVSEDFGRWGVEAMGFPEGVGDCLAGEHLFGVVYPRVFVCPVTLNVVAGTVNKAGEVTWNRSVLSQVREAKKSEYYTGCFGVSYAKFPEFRRFFAAGHED